MERLFLLEILAEKIRFLVSFTENIAKSDLTIVITFGDVTMSISDEGISTESELEFFTGKSLLFPSSSETLLLLMETTPLYLRLEHKDFVLGSVLIPWNDLFTYMVENCEENHLPPVSNKNIYTITNDRGQNVGEVHIFIRLTCLGKNIETDFKVFQSELGNGKQFLFKSPKQKSIPIEIKRELKESCYKSSSKISTYGTNLHLSSLFRSTTEVNSKVHHTTNNEPTEQNKIASFGPESLKLNYSNIRNHDPQLSDTLVWRRKIENFSFTSPVKQIEQIQKLSYTPSSAFINKTQSQKKFKYHRLGSSSQVPELKQNSTSCHTYSQPQISRKYSRCNTSINQSNCNVTNLCKTPSKLCHGCQKLYGGSIPLRLKGGAPGVYDSLPELKVPTPVEACKDLMDEIDQCLKAFKDAMGPCGKAFCPYAPNVTSEICKRVCDCQEKNLADNTDNLDIDPDSPLFDKFMEPDSLFPECYREEHQTELVSACGVPTCPFAKDRNANVLHRRPYCQSATCPRARKKFGEEVDQHKIWMQQLGPTFGQKCGKPKKCPYPLPSKPLPPIHWECPEALPKGQCKNPSCPYTPPILRIKVPPCGNMDCRHSSSSCICCTCVPLPACGNHNCPNQRSSCYPCADTGSEKPKINCANTKCPNKPKEETVYDGPRCTCADDDSEMCDNQACPFKLTHICGSTSCPFDNSKNLKKCGRGFSKKCCGSINESVSRKFSNNVCPNDDENMGNCNSKDDRRIRGGCDKMPQRIRGGCDAQPKFNCCQPKNQSEDQDCGSVNLINDDCGSFNNTAENDEAYCDNPFCPFKTSDFCTDETCGNENKKYSKLQPCSEKTCLNKDCQFKKDEPFMCTDPACPWAIPCIPCPSCFSPCQPCQPCPYTIPCPYENPCSYLYSDIVRKKDSCEEPPNIAIKQSKSEPCKNETCSSAGGDKSCRTCSKKEVNDKKSAGIPEDDAKSAAAPPDTTVSKPGVQNTKKTKHKDTVKRIGKKSRKFAYFIGDQYPGHEIGHNRCVIPGRNVPHNMGWLWNIYVPCLNMKRRRGWRPGLIGRTIAARIQQYWLKKGIKSLTIPQRKRRKRGEAYESSSEESIPPQSTLQVKKRKGVYWITMNPLKDPYKIADNENPYMDCTPMQFKISTKDPRTCFCSENEEDETESELDIDFTPPAGIIRPERLKKKKTIVHADAQYDLKDIPSPPKPKGKGKGKGKGKDKGKKGGKGKKKK